jgi:hypothetical protein
VTKLIFFFKGREGKSKFPTWGFFLLGGSGAMFPMVFLPMTPPKLPNFMAFYHWSLKIATTF